MSINKFVFNAKKILNRIYLYSVLIIFLVIVLFPIYLMIINSFKPSDAIFENPFIIKELNFNGYIGVFKTSNYIIYFRNSIIVSLASIFLILVFSSAASFVLAKYKFAGNRFIYFYFLIGIMIPIRLGSINIVQIFNQLNLLNNLLSLIIIYTVMGIPIGIFVLTGFIRMIPEELVNAARIDGCSDFRIFFYIILPLLKPALTAVTVMNIMPIWNDFWFPLILVRNEKLSTLPLATTMLMGQYANKWDLLLSSLTMSTLPLMIFYLILSKQFQKGLAEGALKG